ncbi:MAG: glycosyltransferase family 1 protein [Syntrophus sp. (in: bacteria)]|nr:glycosyltransferase family 1 protein [Syntrophus sp. (in: bacteria)]
MKKPRICFITAVEITVKAFLMDHCRAMSSRYDITVVTNANDAGFLESFGLNIPVITLSIERRISLFGDISALLALYRLFREYGFDAVHSITPKAGLLSMVAAFFAHIPVRIHTFTGQVWVTRKGIVRWILKIADKLIAFCATHILVDSHSQRDFLIKEKIVSESKSHVIANGSICGVDTKRFAPDAESRRDLREKYSIKETDTVFLYLGRLTYDKGLLDLAQAFVKVNGIYDNAHLVIVGPDEENMKEKMLECCSGCTDRIHFQAYTDKPERFMAAADVFCLPSYREGFGMTIIEAASVGIPSIGTRIYGITDAIEEDITGFLCNPREIKELTEKMLLMVEKPDMRKKMGKQSRKRVIQSYSKELVTSAFVNFYDTLFALK